LALSGIDRFEGFSWIAFVLKSIEPADIRVLTDRPPESPRQRCIEEAWIQNQHRYFTVKVAVLEKRSRRIERLKQALLVSILVVISSLFISGGAFDRMQTLLGISVKNLLTFTLGLMAILLGAWELHQNKMATRELLWQYRNQRGHFARAKALLSRVTSVPSPGSNRCETWEKLQPARGALRSRIQIRSNRSSGQWMGQPGSLPAISMTSRGMAAWCQTISAGDGAAITTAASAASSSSAYA